MNIFKIYRTISIFNFFLSQLWYFVSIKEVHQNCQICWDKVFFFFFNFPFLIFLSLSFFFFFFFGHTCSMWKLPGQGWILRCRCDLCHRCRNAGSLTCCATRELSKLFKYFLIILLICKGPIDTSSFLLLVICIFFFFISFGNLSVLLIFSGNQLLALLIFSIVYCSSSSSFLDHWF